MNACKQILAIGCILLAAYSDAQNLPENWPASYPEWWYDAANPASGVIDATKLVLNQENAAFLKQGQLWNLAAQGIAELDEHLVLLGGAEFHLGYLTNGQSPDYDTPANIGQLKNVASRFYKRFAEVGFGPGSVGWPEGMSIHVNSKYPWFDSPWYNPRKPENYILANQGQAKYLFSWDLATWLENLEEPIAPDGLTAERDSFGNVKLNWNDNSNNETGFLLEYSRDGGATWQTLNEVAANTKSYTVSTNSSISDGNSTFRASSMNAKGTTPDPDASTTGAGTAGSRLINGSFENSKVAKYGYINEGSVKGWDAVSGSDIEVWGPGMNVANFGNVIAADGTNFVELDAYAKQTSSAYGIEQEVDLAPGNYILSWKDRGRHKLVAGQNGYSIEVDLPSGTSDISENFQPYISTWTTRTLVFEVPRPSNGDTVAITVAFDLYGSNANDSVGTFIDDVELELLKMDLAVDNNRDGTIDFGNAADKTEETKPYTFWINNDYDSSEGDDPDGSTPNHSDGVINGIRDLEDFTRLHIDVSSILPMLKDNSLDIALKFEDTTGSPAIKLWAAKDPDGGELYLEDITVAEDHLTLGAPGVIDGSTPYVIAQQYWDDLSDDTETAYLLYEGSGIGKGKLTIELQNNGQVLGDGPFVWLELKDIQSMYERAEATPGSLGDPYDEIDVGDPQVPGIGWAAKPDGFPFQSAWDEDPDNKNYIVFVHGWRMSYLGARTYAENFYKRLWHRGYKGRFAFYRWHTYWNDSFDTSNPVFDAIEAWLSKYNESEYRAWKFGEGLKGFVESLPNGYDKHIAAHSMGNIVASSAIDQGLSVENYALLQAAIPATCFDGSSSLYQSPSSGEFGFTYWDDTTPDDHPSSLVRARSYKEQIPGTSANLINCYLADDVATKRAWEANNAIMKPFQHGILGYTDFYNYDENEIALFEVLELVRVYQNPPPFGVQKLREVADKHENMALLNQSRTKSAGAEPSTGGAIDGSFNLNNFGFGDVHSAEFVWEIQRLKGFYNMILDQFGIDQTLKP